MKYNNKNPAKRIDLVQNIFFKFYPQKVKCSRHDILVHVSEKIAHLGCKQQSLTELYVYY